MDIPVELTEQAIKEVRNIMDTKNIPENYGLRIGVRGGGGCSVAGMNYVLGFDKIKPADKHFVVEGISVFIEKAHFMYLIGLSVDYVHNNEKSGFIFANKE